LSALAARLVSAALREIFNAEDGGQARARVGEVIARLGATVPKLAAPLEEAEEDLLAFYAFSAALLVEAAQHQPARTGQPRNRPPHRRRRHLPNDRSAIRLAGALLIEQNDEWLVGRRYLSAESLALVLVDETEREPEQGRCAPSTSPNVQSDERGALHHLRRLD